LRLPELDYEPTMPAVVRRAAAKFGENDFIVMPDRRMKYDQADTASRRVGRELLAAGVGKGTRVGFMFPYGTDWIVAWWAATRIGALCMPFSTSYRPAELRRALRYGDVDLLMVPATLFGQDHQAFVEEAVPGLAGASRRELHLPDVPYLRSIWVSGSGDRPWAEPLDLDFRSRMGGREAVSEELLEAVEAQITPADLMMTVFTSGTTSEPKAVVHTHGNFLRHGANLARFQGVTPDTRTFCGMPFFWIGGVGLVVNMALAAGAAVLCVERFDADDAVDLMEAEGATLLGIWPQLGQKLRQYVAATGRDVSQIPAFTPPVIEDPELRHNSLGMSESVGPHSSPGPEADRILPEEMRGSFGLLLPPVEHRIVDPETDAVLGPGQEGEICIRGYSLMSGLYKKERYEVFDDDGWYHTGDKGCVRDGYLYFYGRLSEMIKTSGSNVAPREIELTFETYPEVGLAVVMGLPDAERGELVAAALAARPGMTIDADVVLKKARKELSSYKIPRVILALKDTEVPFLASGKPDRLKLRDMLAEQAGVRPSP
jgi:acyl-CoA synthetase (AMP-forming)/AMP-acid ligase II